MASIQGLGTALITPFTPDGEVDWSALESIIEKQVQGGVDYLVVLGTTGEAATLTESEKQAVRRFIVQRVNGRLPLVLGWGGNNTAQVMQDIEQNAIELARDYMALLSVCPYYNKPAQEGLYQHFTSIAQVSPIPILLYNVPGRTGVNLLPETVIRIYESCPKQIMGIKEASGNIEQITQLIRLANRRFSIISGDDGLACAVIQAGGDGLISVASNAWPESFGQIIRQQDESLQNKFAPIVRLLFAEGNPSGIKTVLSQMGLIHNQLRLPLVTNSISIQQAIQKEIASL